MSEKHDDPRVTAYVFGELSSDQAAAFERELMGSSDLKQEVAAIREAVAALRSEFDSRSSNVSPAQRRAVENAIEQRARLAATPVAPASGLTQDRFLKRGAIVSLLAASVLLAVGLTYPYWKTRSNSELSMREPSGASERWIDASTTAVQPAEVDEQPHVEFKQLAHAGSASDLARRGSSLDSSSETANPEFSGGAVARATGPADAYVTDPFGDLSMVEGSRQGERQAAIDSAKSQEQPVASAQASDQNAGLSSSGAGIGGYAGAPSQSLSRGLARQDAAEYADSDSGAMPRGSITADDLDGTATDPGTTTVNLPYFDFSGPSPPGGAASSPSVDHLGGAPQPRPSRRERRMQGMMGMDMEMGMGMGGMQMGSGTSMDNMEMEMGMLMGVAAGDRFAPIKDNPFVDVVQSPLSTFSIDVDTASYSKIRSLLLNHTLPRPDAVRIEELLNYFDYDYPAPADSHPFAASMEIAQCPWNTDHRLARIGIQAKEIKTQRPSSNLVFLLDVSGSMDEPNKLPLVVEGMKLLTGQLTENDKVAIVVYAGAAGVVLDATRGDRKLTITDALERLRAGGSTNGGQGIALAYQIARDHFITGGTNRVILCSDGDFNVGVTGTDELIRIAKENAGSNIFLSVLGFGTGNHNDEMMEKLSNEGNGNYAFIDSKREAEKVFVEELGSTLVTVAKDVKIQIEFNPKKVSAYRLIGYENRSLEARDFADDTKDAGEIGAGHSVTALYELVPAGPDNALSQPRKDLRYQETNRLTEQADSDETLILKLRYKEPDAETSKLIEVPVVDHGKSFGQSDRDFQFAAAVAGFGMLLRNSPHRGTVTFDNVLAIASESAKGDDFGYRTEFMELVKLARALRAQ